MQITPCDSAAVLPLTAFRYAPLASACKTPAALGPRPATKDGLFQLLLIKVSDEAVLPQGNVTDSLQGKHSLVLAEPLGQVRRARVVAEGALDKKPVLEHVGVELVEERAERRVAQVGCQLAALLHQIWVLKVALRLALVAQPEHVLLKVPRP